MRRSPKVCLGPLPRSGRAGGVEFAIITGDACSPGAAAGPDRVRAGLAGLLGVLPGCVVLRRRPGGKPDLAIPAHVGCSIAHCGPLSLLGVSRTGEVGVDLAPVRADLPLDDLADAFFTAAEATWLRTLPQPRRPLATTVLWAAKEAALKCEGTGIAAGMRTPGLDGLDILPLLHGAASMAADCPGNAHLMVAHGMAGGQHLVMAVMSIRPA